MDNDHNRYQIIDGVGNVVDGFCFKETAISLAVRMRALGSIGHLVVDNLTRKTLWTA